MAWNFRKLYLNGLMALDPSTLAAFVGRITASSAAYPYGSAKDESTVGANDGTPYIKTRADDVFGFLQSILAAGAIVPNGSADSVSNPQYLTALQNIFLQGNKVLTVGSPGTDTNFPTEKAIRSAITAAGGGDMLAANNLSDVVSAITSRTNLGLTATAIAPLLTTVGTPGLDTNVVSEQGIREGLNTKPTASLVTTVGTPGLDTNVVSEQGIREGLNTKPTASLVTTVGTPGLDTNVVSEQGIREALDTVGQTIAEFAYNDKQHKIGSRMHDNYAGISGSGKLLMWGRKEYGFAGMYTSAIAEATRMIAPNILDLGDTEKVIQVSGTQFDVFVLTDLGRVFYAGINDTGCAGDGTTTVKYTYELVPGLTGITEICMSTFSSVSSYAFFIQNTGDVYFVGYNANQHFAGDPAIAAGNVTAATKISTLSNVTQLSTTAVPRTHICISGGKAFTWGQNQYGQCGDGTTVAVLTPFDTGLFADNVFAVGSSGPTFASAGTFIHLNNTVQSAGGTNYSRAFLGRNQTGAGQLFNTWSYINAFHHRFKRRVCFSY